MWMGSEGTVAGSTRPKKSRREPVKSGRGTWQWGSWATGEIVRGCYAVWAETGRGGGTLGEGCSTRRSGPKSTCTLVRVGSRARFICQGARVTIRGLQLFPLNIPTSSCVLPAA
jgi:hypothetical protein